MRPFTITSPFCSSLISGCYLPFSPTHFSNVPQPLSAFYNSVPLDMMFSLPEMLSDFILWQTPVYLLRSNSNITFLVKFLGFLKHNNFSLRVILALRAQLCCPYYCILLLFANNLDYALGRGILSDCSIDLP